jgi:hypothetical protein
MWSNVAAVKKGNPSRATAAYNVRISPGTAASRDGTSAIPGANSAGRVTGLWNWLSPNVSSQNLVLYQDGTEIRRRRLSDNQVDTLLTGLTSRAPSFADLATRAYFCAYDTAGAGTIQCRIHDGLFTSGTPDVDVAFRGPLTVSAFTAVDGGAGQCTAGTHLVAFVYQSRSGFAGQPSPVSGGGVFAPASVTLNAGLRTINVSVTFNTPTDGGGTAVLLPIMTRADNPDKWYFVPDGFFAPDTIGVPYNTPAWTLNWTISISDEDLATSANSADEQFNLLVAGASSGPFNPNFVMAYGKRMAYGAGTNVYVSDIDDPQHITQDFHRITLPSQRSVAFGFPLGTAFYLTGDKWTGRTIDNGDLPSTWVQPALVSDSLGSPFPGCVEWRTAGQYAWMVCESGVYVFNGAFPNRPITYLCGDLWKRVNWAAAYAVDIADDVVGLRCYVAVPLDGATECTHQFVIDYTNGIAYDSCDITLDNYTPATFSSIGLVKNSTTKRTELWIGPSSARAIAFLDDSTKNDQGAAVHPVWESGYVRQGNELASETVRLGNADLWIRGNGTLIHSWKGLDGSPTVTPTVMGNGCVVTTLSAAPGIELQAKGDLHPVENYTLRFEVSEVGGWLSISGFTAYTRPSLYSR